MCLEKNQLIEREQVRRGISKVSCAVRNNFPFIIFVDRIFTNLFERLFTKVFDAHAQTSTNP
jgi:hypothetical protein